MYIFFFIILTFFFDASKSRSMLISVSGASKGSALANTGFWRKIRSPGGKEEDFLPNGSSAPTLDLSKHGFYLAHGQNRHTRACAQNRTGRRLM